MSIRNRTTKLIARRHDLNYFKRMSPIRAWQWYLAVVALVCAVAWFATSSLLRGLALLRRLVVVGLTPAVMRLAHAARAIHEHHRVLETGKAQVPRSSAGATK